MQVQSVCADSIDAARQLAEEGVQLDSVFIDGDHRYERVKADIEAWRPLLKSGGLLCGHDYWGATPRRDGRRE